MRCESSIQIARLNERSCDAYDILTCTEVILTAKPHSFGIDLKIFIRQLSEWREDLLEDLMEEKEQKKRRPKGQAALGDVIATKAIAEAMIAQEAEERRRKTVRLRELRLQRPDSATQEPEAQP